MSWMGYRAWDVFTTPADEHSLAPWAVYGVIALRDPVLSSHSLRSTLAAAALADATGHTVEADDLWGFLLHDVGLLEVPSELLGTHGPLSDEGRERVLGHPVRGTQLVDHVPGLDGALPSVLHHHERWDGGGYPSGLRGPGIPPSARLLAVGDAFAALTAPRPHRPALRTTDAVETIIEEAGAQFDPDLAVAFAGIVDDLPDEIVCPQNGLRDRFGRRLWFHVDRADDLSQAQLAALFAAALGLGTADAADLFGRAPGTQRTWAASLRRVLACPPRLPLQRFLAAVGREAFWSLAPQEAAAAPSGV